MKNHNESGGVGMKLTMKAKEVGMKIRMKWCELHNEKLQ